MILWQSCQFSGSFDMFFKISATRSKKTTLSPALQRLGNNRRKLVIALGAGVLTAPFGSFAQQQDKVWRIGYAPFGAPLYSLPGATPK
jgi:hypothetical protein